MSASIPSFPLVLSFYCWPQCPMAGNIPLVRSGHLSQLCSLPASCRPPACWPRVGHGLESFDAVQALFSNSQTTGALSTLLAINTKNSTIWAAMKKVTSIPARPSTISTPYSIPFASCQVPHYPIYLSILWSSHSFSFSFLKSLRTNTYNMYSTLKPSLRPAVRFIHPH